MDRLEELRTLINERTQDVIAHARKMLSLRAALEERDIDFYEGMLAFATGTFSWDDECGDKPSPGSHGCPQRCVGADGARIRIYGDMR
jgi:hypothetical protein